MPRFANAPHWKLTVCAISCCLFVIVPVGYHSSVINIPQTILEDFINRTLVAKHNTSPSVNHIASLWSIIVSIFGVGLLLGNLSVSYLADAFGRKATLFLFANICYLPGNILLGTAKLAHSIEMLVIGRFVVGFACGIAVSSYSVFFSECSPIQFRGFVGTMQSLACELGSLLALVLALPTVFGTAEGWPILLVFNGLFCVAHFVQYFIVPESPRYLYSKLGNSVNSAMHKVEHSLTFFHGSSTNMNELIKEMESEKAVSKERLTLRQILQTPAYWKPIVMSMVVITTSVCTGFYSILAYSTHITRSVGVSALHAKYFTLAMSACTVCSAVLAPFTVHRFPRRQMYLGGIMFIVCCNIGLFVFASLERHANANWAGYAVGIIQVFVTMCWPHGPGSIPLFLPGELSPQVVRSLSTSVTLTCQSIAIMISTFVFYPLYMSIREYCFLISIGVTTVVWTWLYFNLPETNGRSVANVIKEFTT